MKGRLPLILILTVLALSSCRSKKLNLRNDYTILSENSIRDAEKGYGRLSGYLYRSSDNQVPQGAGLSLVQPPFEKLYLVKLNENGYFEIDLREGSYVFSVRRAESLLLESKKIKVREAQKTEVLIYLSE